MRPAACIFSVCVRITLVGVRTWANRRHHDPHRARRQQRSLDSNARIVADQGNHVPAAPAPTQLGTQRAGTPRRPNHLSPMAPH